MFQTNAHIFVVRVKNERMILSKPCHMCSLAIYAFGIKRVTYSTEEGTLKTVSALDLFLDRWNPP